MRCAPGLATAGSAALLEPTGSRNTTADLEISTMRDFACPKCSQRLAFENSVCLGCDSAIGFDLVNRDFAVLGPSGVTLVAPPRQMCANCTSPAATGWCPPTPGTMSVLLTHPNRAADGDPAVPAFAEAETAKRRLVVELIELGLPIIDRVADPSTVSRSTSCPARRRKSPLGTTMGSSPWTSPRATTCTARSCASRWPSRTGHCWGTSGTRSVTTSSPCSRRPARRERSSSSSSVTRK